MSRWGSKQILNWIENNIERGRSEAENLKAVIDSDLDIGSVTCNAEYRAKIARRFK